MYRMRLLLFFAGLLILIPLSGQEITRSTIGSAGSTVFNGGILLRQTIGPPPGTEILHTDFGVLRQGFQQAVNHFTVTFSQMPEDDSHAGHPGFTMYPNPARDFVHISLAEADTGFDVHIADMYGKMVHLQTDLMLPDATLNLQSLSPGVYLITIISSGKRSTQKLVVL